MKRLVLLWMCAWLAGCATPIAPPAPTTLFHDALFEAPTEPVSADDLFTLSPAMQAYLYGEIAAQLHRDGPTRGLIHALQRHDQLHLDYDATLTRNAAQAFAARQGNCLSLVIMTAAFAKALGLEVGYQRVAIDDAWSRSADIAFLNTHVNLTLGTRRIARLSSYDTIAELTVDFLPGEDLNGRRVTPIDETTIVAMYMNNRAAEALARGRLSDAYAWARAAIMRAPGYLSPYNTLGVIYLRHGDWPEAEQVLSEALERAPRDRQLLSNLALVAALQGRADMAAALRARLAKLEAVAPYHDLLLGIAALQQGDAASAKTWFTRQIGRAEDCGECHFWLGLTELRLGDLAQARVQVELALRNSTTNAEHALYAAKLDRLRAVGTH